MIRSGGSLELAPIERKLAELPAILDALREVSSINRDWLKSLHQARAHRTLKWITQMQDR